VDSGINYWLAVERLENWQTDSQKGFTFFAFSESAKLRAQSVRKGDLLFIYVSSRISAFSDVRQVESEQPTFKSTGSYYDEPFHLSISTSPLLVLPQEKWINLKSIADQLSFTRGATNLGMAMRTQLRHLDDSDASLLLSALNNAAAISQPSSTGPSQVDGSI
jgi:predicted RNA-binding protein